MMFLRFFFFRFCQLMGSVFSFVCSEIRSKMDILYDLRKNDKENNFCTMKTMVKYEEENNLLADAKYVSGCRTFLRLHRGLGKCAKLPTV